MVCRVRSEHGTPITAAHDRNEEIAVRVVTLWQVALVAVGSAAPVCRDNHVVPTKSVLHTLQQSICKIPKHSIILPHVAQYFSHVV
jgi:hypothetical protein